MRRAENNEVSIEVDCSNGFYFLYARYRGIRVGSLSAKILPFNSVRLSDVKVETEVLTRDFRLRWIVARWWPRLGMESFRGRGIGTRMLETFLDWCRENGVSEVFGSVVQEDMNETPTLLAWYGRHGFQVSEPDDRCLRQAVHKMTWRGDDPQPSGGSES